MVQMAKIILIIIPIIVPCDNTLTELDVKSVNKNKSVVNKICHSGIVRCVENYKLWKKRKRLSSMFDELRIRIKRRAMDYEYLLDVQSTPVARIDLPRDSDVLVTFKKKWPIFMWRKYLFKDDYLLLINPHWLKFNPPEPAMHYLLGGLCRSLRTPGNILVANLALSDFIMLAKTPIFIFNSFHLGPALGKTGCVFYGFVGGLSGTTSIATLTAIALDRYWAVVYPLQPLRALTAIRAKLFAIGAWIYAVIFSIIPALDIGYGHYVPEGFLTSCSFDYLTDELSPRYFIFAFFCAAWFIPLCIICFCYTRILRIVIGSRNMNNKNQEEKMSSRHVKEQTKRKAEIKLAGLVIAVIALFFISWTPYAIVTLLGIFGKKDVITPGVSMIPALFCKTAACIDPFIYIITHPKFRKELQKLLFRDKSRRMTGTFKSVAYSMEATKVHRNSKDQSDTDVEVIEMKDIPYHNEANGKTVNTVSSKVAKRHDSQKSVGSVSMKSYEEELVSPPSWYTKPQFSRARSFNRTKLKLLILREKCLNIRTYCTRPAYNVLFFGSDGIGLRSLRRINDLRKSERLIKRLDLVTANTSKSKSIIESFAESEGINILNWPGLNISHAEYDLGLIVAFGHLIKKDILDKFPLGIINVHPSLLPRWRGAAPIIYTLLHGDNLGGVSLMKIKADRFDVGEIISQKAVPVPEDILLPDLTNQLSDIGAEMLVDCIRTLPDSLKNARPQCNEGVTYAKKINKNIIEVRWSEMSAMQVYNLYRAIYGIYPLSTTFKGKPMKLFNAFLPKNNIEYENKPFGCLEYCVNTDAIRILCKDSRYIHFKSLRILGKREISALDFYNGYIKNVSLDKRKFVVN
ncbi:unnamed protein product [Leptosia nina]|uniref:Methionyl-tRNA formyltransferase, mitochondrial n=1 Tax=Leptosia nina TaxID=320188 RepID=A0AAV1J8Y9_9NEOP